MAKPYYFYDEELTDVKLTANGTYVTERQSLDFTRGVCVIAAYDASGNAVETITAGSATFKPEPIIGQSHSGQSGGDNPVNLANAEASASYDLPFFDGPIERATLTIANVDFVADGIDHFKAFIWRA